jgi:glycerate kinase
MRFLIAPDKFKGSLNAFEVAQNIALGIRDVSPDAEIEIAPVADGGEGTADIVRCARGGNWVTCLAHDPIGRGIDARYVWIGATAAAVIEMSEAAGLRRLDLTERDPLRTNTFGVGEMLLDSVKRGAREIILGLGGSATNDGGFGLARALGYRFFADNKELTNGPGELARLTRIEPPVVAAVSPAKSVRPQPARLRLQGKIVAAADVQNPLLGERGATRVFAAQKGATPEQISLLEEALTKLSDAVARHLGCDFRTQPGSGAAGGLGFGLMSFCRAELRPGFDVVAEAVQLEEKIAGTDVVITGEGKLDAQTLEGKAPAGVARLARKHGKRIYAIVGQAEREINYAEVFDEIYELARSPVTKIEAVRRSAELLRKAGRDIAGRLKR